MDVKHILLDSIAQVLSEEQALFALDVYEPAVSHQIAMRLTPRFPDHSVDVEYNRHGAGRKVILVNEDGEQSYVMVRPDIVVHARGSDERNLLVVEVKKEHGDLGSDAKKLAALREQYGYRFAAQIVLKRQGGGNWTSAVCWIGEHGE